MAEKIVIGLIGEKGSGKGTVSDYLIEKYGAIHYGTSKILRRTLEDLHVSVTRDNLVKLALVLKEGYGPSVIIDSLIKDMEKNGSDVIIADGIRMHGDVDPFRKKYGENFFLVYVTADLKLRFERTKARKQNEGEGDATFQEFLEEEGKLTEVSIHEIGRQADYKLGNNGTPEELKKQTDEMMEEIRKSRSA
ncbi:MAG: AAA family ATPase [Candidatus Pacebacteria bacterium]|nr:AAA family ATPase [Candidatus Paceibacterota bacterium]MDR3583382.1 AAA family ATPase [Candidatus Paceibacterota bacterium]